MGDNLGRKINIVDEEGNIIDVVAVTEIKAEDIESALNTEEESNFYKQESNFYKKLNKAINEKLKERETEEKDEV